MVIFKDLSWFSVYFINFVNRLKLGFEKQTLILKLSRYLNPLVW